MKSTLLMLISDSLGTQSSLCSYSYSWALRKVPFSGLRQQAQRDEQRIQQFCFLGFCWHFSNFRKTFLFMWKYFWSCFSSSMLHDFFSNWLKYIEIVKQWKPQEKDFKQKNFRRYINDCHPKPIQQLVFSFIKQCYLQITIILLAIFLNPTQYYLSLIFNNFYLSLFYYGLKFYFLSFAKSRNQALKLRIQFPILYSIGARLVFQQIVNTFAFLLYSKGKCNQSSIQNFRYIPASIMNLILQSCCSIQSHLIKVLQIWLDHWSYGEGANSLMAILEVGFEKSVTDFFAGKIGKRGNYSYKELMQIMMFIFSNIQICKYQIKQL